VIKEGNVSNFFCIVLNGVFVKEKSIKYCKNNSMSPDEYLSL